jgi:hypothetical protein
MTTEAPFARKHLPLHGRIGAVENAENLALLFQNALHGGRGEHKKGLKLAQVQEAHHRVDVRRRKENASDGRVSFRLGLRSQFWRGEDLCAQVRARRHQEPDICVKVGSKCDLRLRAIAPAQSAFAKTAAIRTRAIPLRKAASGSGAEDFNAHEDTSSYAVNGTDMKYKEPAFLRGSG